MRFMDLGVFHDVAAAEEIALTCCCWFVSVFYTAFLGYAVAPIFSLCTMCCQMADLQQQSKFYVVLKEGKNVWYQSANSYVHVFFLL